MRYDIYEYSQLVFVFLQPCGEIPPTPETPADQGGTGKPSGSEARKRLGSERLDSEPGDAGRAGNFAVQGALSGCGYNREKGGE